MPLVNVMVNARAYTIACDDGEEDHLRELAKHVDSKTREVLESVGQVGDARLLLMAALLIADEHNEARAKADTAAKEMDGLAASRRMSGDSERVAKSEGHLAAEMPRPRPKRRCTEQAARLEPIAARSGNCL